ncbi:hypothetical protein AVEN_69398-1 [Araneus ventricosus]|uniref:MADF domain-containing protein n=1 Tax=Araneus ventricosus TaxID=182803 RepID=A0A4Y2NHP9_ARAVE|nr:hypothetical protein AVEN_69398-1 [Araneus ventricosus]
MVRFSDRETCKLVELYRQCECLWNVNNANYRNKQVHRATCEAIAREMNIENFTAADVKSKIKNLRSTYNLELIKMKRIADDGIENYRTNIKWFSIMDSIIKKKNNPQSPVDNPSLENGEHTPEGIFPDDSQLEQQSGSSFEIMPVSVSSAPSIPSESEIEQSIRSISDTEGITVTPEIQSVQSLSNSDVDSAISEVQSVQPASHSQVVTVTPEILNVKAVSKTGVIPVTSEIKTVKSVSSPETITVTSGIQQTFKSASTPKFFALVPEIQTSESVSNPRFVTVSAGNNQNVRYVSGSPGIALAPEIQQRVKQISADETLRHRKRRHEVSSTDSNADVRQINNTRTVIGDFSDRSEDEMDAFGHFVALNLRKMSMQSALSAQSEILSVLTRHRLNDSATNLPSKQTFPCIVTNGSSPTQNPVVLQKLFLKS